MSTPIDLLKIDDKIAEILLDAGLETVEDVEAAQRADALSDLEGIAAGRLKAISEALDAFRSESPTEAPEEDVVYSESEISMHVPPYARKNRKDRNGNAVPLKRFRVKVLNKGNFPEADFDAVDEGEAKSFYVMKNAIKRPSELNTRVTLVGG